MLDWHSAQAEHRSHLTGFRCTDPAYPTVDDETGEEFHDYPWELEVQRHINRLRPQLKPPSFLLLGFEAEKLVAVIEIIVTELDRYCFISAVAVSHSHSRRGIAGEALDHVPLVMAKYNLHGDFVAQARVDPNNYSAKSAFAGRGYEFVELVNGYETWARLY